MQLSATVQAAPAAITLNWQPDPYGANSYVVYRKAKTDGSWGDPIATLSGSALSYTDSNVATGSAYEYQIVKNATLGYTGYGYIFVGIQAPLIESRGTLVLITESSTAGALTTELARLQSDLVGDGWQVIRHNVSSTDSAATVRSLIITDYNADPAHVNCVFLFGHVPVFESGNLDYDGHLARAMPADAYYGDINGDWSASPDFLPSDVELMVGRVDFANMPGNGSPVPWPSETELLRNYLNKDHQWRHHQIQVQRRALMGNLRGDESGEATAASGYRNFEPFVGPGNTVEANVNYGAPANQLWISMLNRGDYLCAYACGAGVPDGVSGMGTNIYNFVYSTDVYANDAHAVFVMLFGSWFGQWDDSDDFMRSFLATPSMGLVCCMAGRPHWYAHHLALGETIGYTARLTMNNSTLYKNQTNALARAIYVSLMGDPTLRLDPVTPPGAVNGAAAGNAIALSWAPSSDPVIGYHVYRAASLAGPFSRITASPVTTSSFTDYPTTPGSYTYMVRAIKLEQHFSGSYYNPSQGIFATVSFAAPSAVTVHATPTRSGILLSWNTQPGATYRVQAKNQLSDSQWLDLSGTLQATNATTSWTDTATGSSSQRFYRVASP